MKKQEKNIGIKNNKCVVYCHKRKSDEEIFYIGISTNYKRPYTKRDRSDIWNKYTSKYEYQVEILHENITWEEACNIEKKLISLYGRRDLGLGRLLNMTDGGDGAINRKDAEERINQKREFMLNNNPMQEKKYRLKVSQAKTGIARPDLQGPNSPWQTIQAKQKRREAYLKFYYDSEQGKHYQNFKKEQYKRTLAREDVREKARNTYRETIANLSQEERNNKTSIMNKKIFTCNYCGVVTNKGNYTRWHGESCKTKNKVI